jgi:hypothetical protein
MVFGFPSPLSNEHAKIYILAKQTEKNKKKMHLWHHIYLFAIFATAIQNR